MTNDTSKKVSQAFRKLRRDGYFARMNFLCCSSCGWNAIPDDKVNQAVFYNCQSADSLKETGEVYLQWSGDGEHIAKRLKETGLQVIWDGNEKSAILASSRGLQ